MPSVTAFVADMTTISERPKAMGLVSAAISGGFIIGPGVGGFIAYLGIRAPFCSRILAFIGFILTLTVLKEPEKRILAAVEAKRFIYGYFKKSNVYLIICDYLNFLFGLQAFESIYSIMATINFGFTTSEIAIVITVSGILALICQLFFFDAIVQK